MSFVLVDSLHERLAEAGEDPYCRAVILSRRDISQAGTVLWSDDARASIGDR